MLVFASFSVLWTSLTFLLAHPPYNFSDAVIGLFGLIGASGAASANIAGRIADKGYTKSATGIFLFSILASFLIMVFGKTSLVPLIIGIIIFDFAAQGAHILNQSEIYKLKPEARSRLTTAYITSFFIGGSIGSATSAIIFSKYGWVTNSLAGKDAAHDFWLLVQHQTPEIQRRLLPALEKAAKTGNASMGDYAYLYDRVQVGLGKPQHWGSQSKCQNGKPVLESVDDPAGLDARRKELFMTVPELEAIRQLPLEERHAWRMASALRWGFADFDFARHEGVDRAVSTPARTGRSLVWSKADCRGSRRVP